MTQIKVIEMSCADKLTEAANEWLKANQTTTTVIDIKYSTGDNYSGALIVYQTNEVAHD